MENRMVERAHARAALYYYLAALFIYPDAATWRTIEEFSGEDWRRIFSVLLWNDNGCGELPEALRRIGNQSFVAEHLAIFGHTAAGELRPYEAGYGTHHVFQETHCLADVAGFYRAFGLEPSDTRRERPDHIAVELEFMHVLALKEAYALANGWSEKAQICREAQRVFLRDHLGRWAPSCLRILGGRNRSGIFAMIADATIAGIAAHCRDEDIEAGSADLAPAAAAEPEGNNFSCMGGDMAGADELAGASISVREEAE